MSLFLSEVNGFYAISVPGMTFAVPGMTFGVLIPICGQNLPSFALHVKARIGFDPV